MDTIIFSHSLSVKNVVDLALCMENSEIYFSLVSLSLSLFLFVCVRENDFDMRVLKAGGEKIE